MEPELEAGQRQALSVLAETSVRDRLTAEELDAWLRALTDLRLVIGTRLEVTEDTKPARSTDRPEATSSRIAY